MDSEQDVEESLVSLAHEAPSRALAVIASGQNLDRLVSCYRAAQRSGRLLVIDPYQAFVLMKLAPLSPSIQQFGWEGVKVRFAPHQVERLKTAGLMDLVYEMGREGKVSSDALAAEPGRYLLCARGSYGTTKLLDHIGAAHVELVWSMWGGYWKRDKCAVREWAQRHAVEP
jgi:ribonuclease J